MCLVIADNICYHMRVSYCRQQSLEGQGLLRILRYTNDGDIVPTLPDRQNCSCLRTLRRQPSVYRHAGPNVILYANGNFEIRYEQRDKETAWKFMHEARITCAHGVGFAMMVPTLLRFGKYFLTNHGCEEYMKRFVAMSNRGGDKVSLNDIYKKSCQVGYATSRLAQEVETGWRIWGMGTTRDNVLSEFRFYLS